MPLEEPSWWYGNQTSDWRANALEPVAGIYGWAAERRFKKTQPFRSELPVICVGNFTAGGTGKTPMSLLLAELLTQLGERPAFLSRGYAGRIAGPEWVDPHRHSAIDVGDEPLLLASSAPTMICRDRPAGARAILTREPRPTVIIMDDGLQNPSLEKDLRLAIVDGARGIGNGRVIPAGPLRAPLQFQYAMTDAVIVNGSQPPHDDDRQSNTGTGVLDRLRHRFLGPVLVAEPEPAGDISWLADTPVIAFAGIANPHRFFSLLERLGATVLAKLAYRDHHTFTDSEAEKLLAQAKASGAQLVTTEKDLVRMTPEGNSAIARLRQSAHPLPIRLQFKENDLSRMRALLEAVIADSKLPA